MPRAFLIILSVLALALAFAFDSLILYVLFVAFLVGAISLFLLQRRSTNLKGHPTFAASTSVAEPDLSDLGILEIRPKQKITPVTGSGNGVLAQTGNQPDIFSTHEDAARATTRRESVDKGTSPAAGIDVDDGEAIAAGTASQTRKTRRAPETTAATATTVRGEVKPTDRRMGFAVVSTAESIDERAVIPCLQSLHAAASAQTVCLLGCAKNPTQYRILAVVSTNGYARSSGQFTVSSPFVTDDSEDGILVWSSKSGDIDRSHLRYYRDKIAVRHLAAVPFTVGEAEYVLLVDRVEAEAFNSASQRALLGQFAKLLATLLGAEMTPPQGVQQDQPSRREIIAAEIRRARLESRPLALALVVLNRSGEIAEEGTTSLEEAEAAMLDRLTTLSPNTRVEKFGELTYGVFYHGSVIEVEQWALRLERDIESSDISMAGGVSVGVALMKERHRSADDLRLDAKAALQEAFETGTCTILE